MDLIKFKHLPCYLICFLSLFLTQSLQASSNNLAEQHFQKAQKFILERNYSKAVTEYHKAAELGHVEAQFWLGTSYLLGMDVQQNIAKGISWYRKAAENNDVVAQNRLAGIYYSGEFVKKDAAEAAKWFLMAANNGDAYAQKMLGWLYYLGDGVKQDYGLAIKWLSKAKSNGGLGVESKLKTVFEDPKVQLALGYMYYNDKEYAEAADFFSRSAQQGNSRAQYNLGVMYQNGEGVKRNSSEAAKWYAKAAAQGDADAQNNLGWLYQFGIGVEQDKNKARHLYQQASAQGNKSAQHNLKNMDANNIPKQKKKTDAQLWGEVVGSLLKYQMDKQEQVPHQNTERSRRAPDSGKCLTWFQLTSPEKHNKVPDHIYGTEYYEFYNALLERPWDIEMYNEAKRLHKVSHNLYMKTEITDDMYVPYQQARSVFSLILETPPCAVE